MRILASLTMLLALASAGCGTGDNSGTERLSATAPSKNTRGGIMTVGGQTWAIIPSVQCGVFPGNVVHVAGHAAEDPTLEIVIDHGGPTGASIGSHGTAISWYATRDTLRIEIDGRRVRGTATFTQYDTGTGASADGSFDLTC